jgi:predicted SprT family Zn-dependent metalloprotease
MKTLKESILDADFDIDEISTLLSGIKFIKTGDNQYECSGCQEEFYLLKRRLLAIAKETGKPRGSKFADMYILNPFNEYITIIQKLSIYKYLMLTVSFTAYGKTLGVRWSEIDYNPAKVSNTNILGERVGRIPVSVIKSLQIR